MPPDLRTLQSDRAAFAEHLGLPLEPWQLASIRLRSRTSVLVAGRQLGKTRSLVVLVTHEALRQPGHEVLFISAGEDAAKEMLAKVRQAATGSPVLRVSVVEESRSEMRFSNGSRIRAVPASEAQVRGRSVDLLIIDEAAFVGDDLMRYAALPTTMARPDARIVLASSPHGRSGLFFELAMQGLNGGESVDTYTWRIELAPWVTAEVEADMRRSMSPERARAEIDGEFVDLADGHALLEPAWIEAALERVLPEGVERVLGIDPARYGPDRTVGVLNAGGRCRVVLEGRGWPTDRTAGEVAGLLNGWTSTPGTVRVVIDEAGVGGGVVDRARRLNVPVRAFLGAAKSPQPKKTKNLRASSYWSMREAFEQGLIDLSPTDRTLVDQLRGLTYEHDDKGAVLMTSKTDMARRGLKSPDHADALSMTFVDDRAWRFVSPDQRQEETKREQLQRIYRLQAAHRYFREIHGREPSWDERDALDRGEGIPLSAGVMDWDL